MSSVLSGPRVNIQAPRSGRTLSNHLAAFHRLIELRSITLRRVRRWAAEHDVEPYVIIDPELGLTS
ncbi:MAG: hypothetical protein ACHP9Z_20415 [Streptosporangiales bacterium]